MRILIAIKSVVDHNVNIRIKENGSDVDIENEKKAINPFDEIAVEEAIRMNEKKIATEITAVSIGNKKSEEVLRKALAMGVHNAVLIETDEKLEPLNIAKTLKNYIDKEKFDLILLGKQAIDNDASQVGPMLAGLLNYNQATFVSKIEKENEKLRIIREIDNGTEELLLNIPAVISVDLNLNKPRFIKLPNLMKAKKARINYINDIEIANKKKLEIIRVEEPKTKEKVEMLKSINDLLEKLKNKEKII